MSDIIFAAAIISLSLFLSISGYMPATFVLIGLVVLHIFAVVVAAVKALVYYEKANVRTSDISKNIPIRYLIQCFLAAVLYHLYALGFVLLSGMMSMTLAVAFLTTFIYHRGMILEKEEK